ncbi:MAG: hypothetical protein SGARI_007179, partial [Bacillariaceae sp.]
MALQSITAMQQYENKSFEELRLEDYTARAAPKQRPVSATSASAQTSATATANAKAQAVPPRQRRKVTSPAARNSAKNVPAKAIPSTNKTKKPLIQNPSTPVAASRVIQSTKKPLNNFSQVSPSTTKAKKKPRAYRGLSWLLKRKKEDTLPVSETTSLLLSKKVAPKLESCQSLAIQYVNVTAQIQHEYAWPLLMDRIKRLQYSEAELLQCLEHIQEEGPIIIHFNQKTLKMLVEDTHYRNCFETGISSASSKSTSHDTRRKWEHNMF